MAFSRFIAGAALGAAAALLLHTGDACAHGLAGDRFFPATILTDDPFVADEMSLPTVTRPPTGTDGAQEIDIDVDLAKRITPNFGITVGQGWKYLQPKDSPAVTGLSGLHTGAQYQLFVDGPHEALALLGLNVSWAHTGRVAALGAPDFTTLSPTFISARASATSRRRSPICARSRSPATSVWIFRLRPKAPARPIRTMSITALPSNTAFPICNAA